MNLLEVKNLSKSYIGKLGSKQQVLEAVNITLVESDKFTAILGPQGSGKTTLLKTIAGLEVKDTGNIQLLEESYNKCGKGIAYIPEKPSSFPWSNVKENISLIQKISKNENEKKQSPEHFISLVGLSGYEAYTPANKSLGFRFRISLAQALATFPKLILLDDCFKKMSEETRVELYQLTRKINEELEIPFLLASTNVNEALLLSTKVFLMKNNPGSIFETIDVNIDEIPGKLNEYKNKVELLFRSKKIINTINFSI